VDSADGSQPDVSKRFDGKQCFAKRLQFSTLFFKLEAFFWIQIWPKYDCHKNRQIVLFLNKKEHNRTYFF